MDLVFDNNGNIKINEDYKNKVCGLFRLQHSLETKLITRYLNKNFFVERSHISPNVVKKLIIHRKDNYLNEICGQEIAIEISKIFNFSLNFVERDVKFWLNYCGINDEEIEEIWKSKDLMFNEFIIRFREQGFTHILNPSQLLMDYVTS